ncbi:MAG: hypothetical protein HDT46_02110 [Ruminococcaceae bacterium]|nr:hypothetical protein [Oscillospiraceae bacterium]
MKLEKYPCFSVWADGWKASGGNYEVMLAASSRDIRLRGNFKEKSGEIW